MDGFDQLPDSLIHLIFNSVCDTKTLIRCRSVSKRFNSLIPQTESLLLKVDCVISPESDPDSLLLTLLKSFFKSLHHLLSSSKPTQTQSQAQAQNSPAQILSRFSRIRHLSIELPAGDLRLGKNAVVKWKAEFGKSLKSCVIFGFRCVTESTNPSSEEEEGEETEFAAGGLKDRVVWTISALIAASARHFLLKEVVREHKEMEKLVLSDKEEEGTLVMDKDGLKECREDEEKEKEEEEEHVSDGCEGNNNRTMVPNVRMRMRHRSRVQLKGSGGGWVEGATLVVVRPSGGKDDDVDDDVELALGAFGSGVYGEAVHALLKNRSYMLEMNSF